MNYADIVALIQNDECSKIIYVLKKTPGLVHYKNGNVIYSNIAKNAFYRFFDKWTSNISVWLFGLGLIVSFSLLVFGDGVIAITGFILTLVTSIMFGLELHQRSYNRMIANLVEQGNNE